MKKRLFTLILAVILLLMCCACGSSAPKGWHLEAEKDQFGDETGYQAVVFGFSGKDSKEQKYTGTLSFNADTWTVRIRDAKNVPVSFAPQLAGGYTVILKIGDRVTEETWRDHVSYGEEITFSIGASDLGHFTDALLRGENVTVLLKGEYSPSYTFTVEAEGFAAAWFKRATALFEKKEYRQAENEFAVLAQYGHPGASEQVQACEDAIHGPEYEAAAALFNEGKYEEAKAAFAALGGYKDSADMVKECDYQKAKALYAAGDYAGASAIFLTIKGYKDVDSLLATDERLICPGKIVTLGTWGGEPIEWQVLEVKKDGTCVLLSVKGLDTRPYNTKKMAVTWETCTLRAWLNGEFYETAFSESEKGKIVLSTVENPDNKKRRTSKGGNTTQDHVYLLSLDEVGRYFHVDPYAEKDEDHRSEALICMPTQTAVQNGAGTVDQAWMDQYQWHYSYPLKAGACEWWLRSPGEANDFAAYITGSGYVTYDGFPVKVDTYVCVRPVVCARF